MLEVSSTAFDFFQICSRRMQLYFTVSLFVVIFFVSTLGTTFFGSFETLTLSAAEMSTKNYSRSDLKSILPRLDPGKNVGCVLSAVESEGPCESFGFRSGHLSSVIKGIFPQKSLRNAQLILPPVIFDNFYSIDNRGNTRHYVDDSTSIAKVSYPLRPVLRNYLRSSMHVLKIALPFGINIAQSM